jgi:hypothetical protein
VGKIEGSIALDKQGYKTEEEFDIALSKLIKILTKSNYDCLVKYEDMGIYVVEYCYNENALDGSCDRFIPVSIEEMGLLEKDE